MGKPLIETVKKRMAMMTFFCEKGIQMMIERGDVMAMETLFIADWNPNQPIFLKNGHTCYPIHKAVRYPAVLLLLLEHDAIVDQKDSLGNTALHYAVECKNPMSVAMLLDLGADPDSMNRATVSPLSHALSWHFRENHEVVQEFARHKTSKFKDELIAKATKCMTA